jgi:hypothetical protein
VQRDTLRRYGLAGLAVVAIAVAAATIDSTVAPAGGSGLGSASGAEGVGTDPSGGVGVTGPPAGEFVPLSPCVEALRDPVAVGVIVLAFLVVGGLAYRSTGSFLPPLALWLAFGLPVGLIYAVLTSCGAAEPFSMGLGGAGNSSAVLPSGGGAGALGGATGRQVSTPTAVLGVVLVVALLGSVLLLLVSTGDEEAPDADADDPVEEPETPDVAALGRAAGAAADRIEDDADVDNEVYRAWAAMTRHLEVPNPETSTPAEFALAAVDAGMAREDVTELTDLFETVRYGGEAATADREERAVAALRRIESAYADADAEATGDVDPDPDPGSGPGPDDDASGGRRR